MIYPCPHRALLHDATPRSLVLLDEMGKVTEVLDATSLSGALLEDLADRSCTNVIFATHLHDLVGGEQVGEWEFPSPERGKNHGEAAASYQLPSWLFR